MANTQKRVARIAVLTSRKEQEEQLLKLAAEKGASRDRLWTATPAGAIFDQPELIRRIQEADKSLREGRIWWFALISAIASVVSASAALYAVIRRVNH
ncbi:MAG: hypothetical protein HYZ91_00435 [Candidatus Omnitrophica bacterium]|nr:hypothetical protein [Candidatus Omnitrophota bacterium]